MGNPTFDINWNDFAENYAPNDVVGGELGRGDLEALNKAMSAGDGQAVPGSAVAGALAPIMPESLEATLQSLTYTNAKFPFWMKLQKSRAFNTAEEFNQLLAVGSGESAFIGEGDLPEEEDSTYKRNVTMIKFMGVTRRVTHVGSLVKTVGVADAVAAATRDGTTWLMRHLEQQLFEGDSSLVPIQFDGLRKQLVDGGAPTFDLRGAPLTIKIVNGIVSAVAQAPNYGEIDHLFMSVGVKSDLVNDNYQYTRGKFGETTALGLKVDEIQTQTLDTPVKLQGDVFLRETNVPIAAGVGNAAKRPLTPAAGGALAHGAHADSVFAAADAGAYWYKVVAVNRYGRSTPLTFGASVAVVAGDRVSIPVVDGGQGTTCYIVYRSSKDAADASDCKEIFRFARTGAAQTLYDYNSYLPGTSVVYGMELQADGGSMVFKQLAPFTKLPLATVDTSIRWMMLLYGALQVRKPRHNCLLINVGRDPNSPIVEQIPGIDGV